MKILTSEEMRRCDEYTIDELMIPADILMERAGHSFVHAVLEETAVLPEKVLVACGKGNNGGDGLVAAREFSDLGSRVTVVFPSGIENLTRLCSTQLERLSKSDADIIITRDYSFLKEEKWDVIVDAVFGIGLNKNFDEKLEEFFLIIRSLKGFKAAVDIPSGINSNNGSLYSKNSFKADLTVTFGYPKSGMFFYPAREKIGKLKVSYISIPPNSPDKIGWNAKYLMNEATAKRILPERYGGGHKGTFGKAAVIGGSEEYKGAPCLSLNAAMKCGCGIVTGYVPKSIESQCFSQILPEAILKPVKERDGFLSYSSLDFLLKETEKSDVTLIGPGMGRKYSTVQLVREVVKKSKNSLVIDADAINALDEDFNFSSLHNKEIVLTPHLVEFSRLCGLSPEEIQKDLFLAGSVFAKKNKVVLVLKGATTVIFTPKGEAVVNITGNSGLSKGGSGDVLAGIITSFMAQGLSGTEASQLSVYIHGKVADNFSENNWQGNFSPSRLIEMIPEIIAEIKNPR